MEHDKYKKDISNLKTSFIDVYRVLSLFNVTDPCIQHAIKKLLCAGDRGVKDKEQDIREAKDCLSRYFAMRVEESAKSAKSAKLEMPTWDIKICETGVNAIHKQQIIYGENEHEKTLSADESKQDATKEENAGTYKINGFYGS